MRALLVVLSVREYAEVHAQLVRAPRSTDRPSERATTQALRARLRECDGDHDVDDDLSRTVHVRRNDADVQKGLDYQGSGSVEKESLGSDRVISLELRARFIQPPKQRPPKAVCPAV